LAGQYNDSESSLHYNCYRYFDPNFGRYLRLDPYGLSGGINLYAYVSNKPLELVDPFGLLGFRHHGNWGGPGWAAGREISESDLTEEHFSAVPATDDRDECYRGHDRCIWEEYQRQGDCLDEKELSDAIEKCDHKLGNCLLSIPPWKLCHWVTDRGNNSKGEPMGIPLPAPVEAAMFHSAIPVFVH
jgi:RHS repeat-associated protein